LVHYDLMALSTQSRSYCTLLSIN